MNPQKRARITRCSRILPATIFLAIFSCDLFDYFWVEQISWPNQIVLPDFSAFKKETQSDKVDHIKLENTLLGRTHYWHVERSIDFVWDSLSYLLEQKSINTKGLYWESSNNNMLLTSYITSLDSTPGILKSEILPYQNCQIYTCIWDAFISDYAINQIVLPTDLDQLLKVRQRPNKSYTDQVSCLRKFQSPNYAFESLGNSALLGRSYTIYDVKVRQDRISNQMIEPLTKDFLIYNDLAAPDRSVSNYMKSMALSCRETLNPFRGIGIKNKNDMQQILAAQINLKENLKISISKKSISNFEISTLSNSPIPFHVKMNYFPGLKLSSQDEKDLPLFPASHGFIGVGNGMMTLSYKTPIIFYISNILSILSLLFTLFRTYTKRF